jgi:ferredoxin
MKRIDERDVLFARLRYRKETEAYHQYYTANPDKLERDEAFRNTTTFGSEGTMSFDTVISPFTTAAFDILGQMHHLANGPVIAVPVSVNSDKLTAHIKKFSSHLGAVKTGIAKMQPHYFYSHKGRNNRFGEVVSAELPYGIAFLVEMDEQLIDRAPQLESAFAVTKGYMDAAIIAIWIAQYLRNLGYEATAHTDGNYEVNCPMVAEGAGLGQIGRIGILVSHEFGPRVRIGVVTTNAPLHYDEPFDFDLKSFCESCNRCSKTCPGKAISSGEAQIFDGFVGWNTNQESCYTVWTRLGTDCGVCLSSCPFSHHIETSQAGKWRQNPSLIGQILEGYERKYGIRPYIKEKLPLILE